MEAGTKIKNLIGRLVTAEATAKNLFNEAMKLNNVMGKDDKLFTYDDLSALAKKDLPMAIQKLSELKKEGVLTDTVLSKLFTNRHGLDLANLLDQINGNVETFTNGLATGLNYIDDTAKNMFNINNQMKQFQNNSLALAQTQLQTINDVGTGGLMIVNEALKSLSDGMNSIPKSLSNTLGTLSTSLVSATVGISSIYATSKLLTPLFVGAGSALGAWVLPVTAVIAGLSFLIKQSYDIKKAYVDSSLAISNLPKEIQNSIIATDVLNSKTLKTKELIEEASNPSTKGLDSFSIIMDTIIDKSKILKSYLDASANWDFGYNFKSANSELDDITSKLNDIKSQEQKYLKGYDLFKTNILSNALYEESQNPKRELTWIEKQLGFKQGSTRSEVLELFFKYKEQNIPVDQISDKISKELSGISKRNIEIIIGNIDLTPLDRVKQKMSELNKEKELLETKRKGLSDDVEKQAKANIDAINKLNALKSDTLYNELLKTGSATIDGELISGLKGVTSLTDKYLLADYNNSITLKEQEIASLKEEIIQTTDLAKEQNRELTQSEQDSIQSMRDKVDVYEKQKKSIDAMMSTIKNNSGSITKELQTMFAGIDITAQNFETIMKIARLIINRDFVQDEGAKKTIQEIIDSEARIVKHEDQQRKARQANHTKYQLKHISYLKENLQLELEIAKIGASKEKQAYLEYEYKLKTLEANKQLASQEKKNVLDMVRDYKAESSIGSQYLSKALKASSASEIQQLLNEFESKHSGIMIGDSGKRIKSDYDQIVKIMKATKQVEDAGTKFKVEIQKGISSIQNAMSSEMFSALAENNARYISMYLTELDKEFLVNKKKLSSDFGLKEDFDISQELLNSATKIDFLKIIGMDYKNLDKYRQQFINIFGESVYKAVLGDEENLALLMAREVELKKGLLELNKQDNDKTREKTKQLQKQLEILGTMAEFSSKIGDIFGVELFKDLGSVMSAIKDVGDFKSNPNNSVAWSDIGEEIGKGFEKMNLDFISDSLNKKFTAMFKEMGQGNTIGTLVGNITGGGQSSQMAGSLAGLVTGAMTDLNPFVGAGIQVGASLLGGFFDKGNKDQERAERRTKEANKIYNKNTEALQKLSQNMANLNGGVDGLNNALISSFSKIPTVGNLNRVTDAMSQLYKTMDKTRIFNEVAYQVTKTKKGKKGFLGIGGSAGTSWTETIKISVQELLNRYGFKGTINDMTSQQIRDFSKWLDDYDLGDSDNFSVLADALENYAEALDKMEKNVEKFFYDSTMESFEGISSLQQEELRQQIEDFYKNLGLQIDEETSKEIDKLAEQMSVMVTIMQDVRGNFIKSWKDSGLDAGRAFVTSMQPYVEAMLTNISQIYYDVYFSDVNKQLEDEFKALSEKLVELKKKGGELNWGSVADELSGSFEKVIAVINSTKNETESFNTILLQLQKQAIESGLSLSEIFDLGLVTGTQKTVIESFKDALSSNEADSAFKSIGNMVGEKVGEALVNKMIDSVMGDKIFEMSAQLDKVLSGGNLNFDSLAGLANDAMSVGTMLEQQRLRFEAIKSMFDFSGDITYENQNSNINYESGVSSQNVYNIYVNGTVEAGTVVESDSVERLLDEITDTLVEKLRVEKGIDLRKLQ